MKLFVGILFCIGTLKGFAQNSTNYLNLTVNTPLNFSIDDATKLETGQVLTNAIKLQVRTQTTCSIHAKISSYSIPAGFYPTNSALKLNWQSDTSPNVYLASTQPIELQTYDETLFTQTKTGGNVYSYFYNVIISGVDYTYPPGNYSYTILFSMTQP